MNPRVLKTESFKYLDRVIDLCAKQNIYTILDMHTLPGGQSPGWHADNHTSYAAFWDHKDFQDRTVWLWRQLASRYRNNPWIAGYNPINEPADSEHVRLPAYYARLEKEIREVDADHILYLDGNTFAMDFSAFKEVLPNSVYSLHDYSTMGFPTGAEPYRGLPEQKALLRKQFQRKCEFQNAHKTAIWNGEFGPVYASPEEEGAEETNRWRYELLGEQLRIYDEVRIPWCIWLYKDIGLQGMVHTSPSSPWNKLIAKFLQKKRRLQVDKWGRFPGLEGEEKLKGVVEWIERVCPSAGNQYPTTFGLQGHVERAVLQTFLADSLQDEFAELFREKTEDELETLAASFRFENCVQREGLNEILRDHAKVRGQ